MQLRLRALLSAAIFVHVQSFAFGPEGHMAVGSIADELLSGTKAAEETRKILGSNLRTASVWADCAKGVNQKTFKYGKVGKYPECKVYEDSPGSIRLMEDFVHRNVGNCELAEVAEVCHKQYHYADVAIQRDQYKLGLTGTSKNDVIAAVNAMIEVLEGRPAPSPFDIVDKKEALRLLVHYVGDIHQPLHVGAVYVDGNGAVVDPDNGKFDRITETTGGNDLLLDRPVIVKKPRKARTPRNLHHEWDTVRGAVISMPVLDSVRQKAREIPSTSGPRESWSAQWATESLIARKVAHADMTYEPLDKKAGLYLIRLPPGYDAAKNPVQQQRVIEAGARLAHILSGIKW